MRELLTVEEFFVETFDLISRYVGENIGIKIRLFDCRDYFVPDLDLLEKNLLKTVAPLRDAIYQDGGKLIIDVYPMMYMSLTVYFRAVPRLNSRTVIGANLYVSREILLLTPLTKLPR